MARKKLENTTANKEGQKEFLCFCSKSGNAPIEASSGKISVYYKRKK